MDYIVLGKIVKTIGLKGEVKVLSSTDFSSIRYKKNNKVFLFDEKKNIREEFTISSFHKDKNADIISFKELNSIDEVSRYLNFLVQIPKINATLPKDFYHFSDLEKCFVYDENNNLLGHVKKVEQYASYETLRISRPNKKDFLVPFVSQFIKKVDIENKSIIIHIIEGLL